MKRFMKYVLTFIFSFMMLIPNMNALEEKFVTKADDNVNVNEEVLGSTALAGNNINSNNKVNGILFSAGNNIKISGEAEYAIIAGNSIDVNNNISNDVIIAGNNINISKNVKIGRDIIIMGNTVNVSGTIGRDVQIYASSVNINDAVISGNVVVSAEKITIDENTMISRKLTYNEDSSIEIANKGNIAQIEVSDAIELEKITIMDIIVEKILSFARILVVLFALILIVPPLFKKLNKMSKDKNIKDLFLTLAKGLMLLIVVPIISLILIISNLGLSLGFVLAITYGILIYVSTIFTGFFIGKLISDKFIKKEVNNFLVGTIGLLVMYILKFIPYVNGLVSFLSIIFGLGIIFDLFKKTKTK